VEHLFACRIMIKQLYDSLEEIKPENKKE